MKILSKLVVCLVTVFIPVYGWAACSWVGNTGTVAFPYAASDVQACIADASSKTGEVTIQIPNCSVMWSSVITVNMRSGFTNVTGLTIRGQNDCTLDTSEIFTGIPICCGTNITGMTLSFTGSANKKFRFAHARLTGATSGNVFSIDGDSASPNGGWRIDHIFFDNVSPSSRFVWFNRLSASYGLSDGLIDHCYVLNLPPSKHFLQYQVSADGGNREWMTPLKLGTAAAIYIEDNKLYNTTGSNSAFAESQGGGRFVVRYNKVHNSYFDAHDAIVTGLRGVRKYEFYNNTVSYDANQAENRVLIPRGGSGVFFNNAITNSKYSYYNVPQFAIYRYHQKGGDPWDVFCSNSSGKAILDTTSNYPRECTSGTGCIDIDGDGPGGYPCRDQLGADWNNPQVGGAAPFLIWNNTFNGSNHVSPQVTSGYGEALMVNGRDYCLAEDWVTMPRICNGITTTYTPYTYPHPLMTEGVDPEITSPAAPVGLRIIN